MSNSIRRQAIYFLVLALLLTNLAQAQVIFDSFGPNGTYSLSGGLGVQNDPDTFDGPTDYVQVDVAVEFTPTTTSQLGLVALPLGFEDANTYSGDFLLQLVANNSAKNTPTGAVLTTLVNPALSSASSALSAGVFTFTPTTSVTLSAGISYWVVASLTETAVDEDMYWYGEPATGAVSETFLSGEHIGAPGNGSLNWQVPTLYGTPITPGPALEVLATPEPSTWSLLLLAMAVSLLAPRRLLASWQISAANPRSGQP